VYTLCTVTVLVYTFCIVTVSVYMFYIVTVVRETKTLKSKSLDGLTKITEFLGREKVPRST
jgi:hypothetical protein